MPRTGVLSYEHGRIIAAGGSGLYHQSWHGRLTPARERALETVAKGTVEAD